MNGQLRARQRFDHLAVGELRPEEDVVDRLAELALPANSSSAAPVPQPPSPMFGMDEDAVHAGDLRQALVQLDVGDDAARQHEVLDPGLPQVMRDVVGSHPLQHVLIGSRDVDLRELRGEHAREEQVVVLDDAERPVGLVESAGRSTSPSTAGSP